MGATSVHLDKGLSQVDSVLASLDKVVANKSGDLRPAYDAFGKEVDKTMDVAAEARKSADSMKARAKEQFDAWFKESQNITEPSVQKASLERRDQARAAFNKVQEDGQKVKAAYDPFITGLKDTRSFLSTDLTSHGVDALSKTIDKVHSDGKALKAAITSMQQAMTEFKGQVVSPRGK
jgi:hypothetical protein